MKIDKYDMNRVSTSIYDKIQLDTNKPHEPLLIFGELIMLAINSKSFQKKLHEKRQNEKITPNPILIKRKIITYRQHSMNQKRNKPEIKRF